MHDALDADVERRAQHDRRAVELDVLQIRPDHLERRLQAPRSRRPGCLRGRNWLSASIAFGVSDQPGRLADERVGTPAPDEAANCRRAPCRHRRARRARIDGRLAAERQRLRRRGRELRRRAPMRRSAFLAGFTIDADHVSDREAVGRSIPRAASSTESLPRRPKSPSSTRHGGRRAGSPIRSARRCLRS